MEHDLDLVHLREERVAVAAVVLLDPPLARGVDERSVGLAPALLATEVFAAGLILRLGSSSETFLSYAFL